MVVGTVSIPSSCCLSAAVHTGFACIAVVGLSSRDETLSGAHVGKMDLGSVGMLAVAEEEADALVAEIYKENTSAWLKASKDAHHPEGPYATRLEELCCSNAVAQTSDNQNVVWKGT